MQMRKKEAERPNIILFWQTTWVMEIYHAMAIKTLKRPILTSWLQTGTRFTQCYAGSAISSPSRCALMTGKNTGNTTIRDNFVKQAA